MPNKQFQYISCCSLSFYSSINKKSGEQVSIHLMLQFIQHSDAQRNSKLSFQYISCCSLSNYRMLVQKKNFSFNTSHVVVYRRKSRKRRKTAISFNTSHVVVYQSTGWSVRLPVHVSIHLMLQFIGSSDFKSRWNGSVSIHLMLQFISLPACIHLITEGVSIHLMLQFISF